MKVIYHKLKSMIAVLVPVVSILLMADEPAWPENFDLSVSERVAAAVPSGDRAASCEVAAFSIVPFCKGLSDGAGSENAAFDSRFRVIRESLGGNMSSYPIGSVISIR